MENYGQKIAELRKKNGLTQADLGRQLNVTAQAVSKWENGLSEPDFETTKKLCEIFGITLNEFFGTEPTPAPVEETVPAVAPTVEAIQPLEQRFTPTPAPKIIVGYCTKCKKPISQTEEYVVDEDNSSQIYCKSCHDKEVNARKEAVYSAGVEKRKKSFIVGGILGVIAMVICAVALTVTEYYAFIPLSLALGYAVFAFTAQCYWGEAVLECLGFFLRTFKAPGLIFTWDLDGFLWVIGMKILFAVIGFIFTTTIFIFGLFITLAFSMVSFPFALMSYNKSLANGEIV